MSTHLVCQKPHFVIHTAAKIPNETKMRFLDCNKIKSCESTPHYIH